ncbi:DUF4240 domain-containing protein [Streptomyces sp. NPDC089799]|uniref:DUF4240 domain-containing protein n=1 Tax=Streptomyces sp. NPDC089799 TaxID=3155066 RepID=UPI0034216519
MDENAFWDLLEDCRPAGPDPDADLLAAALTVALSTGPLHRVVAFAEWLSWLLYRLDRREYGRGLPGDVFLHIRCAVVAAGRAAYESVLADPAEFAPYAEGPARAEDLLYVPDQAYEHLTGEQWPRATRYSYESFTNREGWSGAWLGGT